MAHLETTDVSFLKTIANWRPISIVEIQMEKNRLKYGDSNKLNYFIAPGTNGATKVKV